MDKISEAFEQIKQKQYLDKNIIKDLKVSTSLKEDLQNFLKQLRGEDEIVLFNWFAGSQLNICINDLRK